METKELMAQNVQDPAQAGEVLLQPPKRPKKKRSIKKIVLLSLAGIAVLARVGSETKRNFGSSANALARQTFCWLPPESSLAFCFELVHLIFSSSI